MTARPVAVSPSTAKPVSAANMEPPTHLGHGVGVYRAVLRCEVDLHRSGGVRAGARQATSFSPSSGAAIEPGERR